MADGLRIDTGWGKIDELTSPRHLIERRRDEVTAPFSPNCCKRCPQASRRNALVRELSRSVGIMRRRRRHGVDVANMQGWRLVWLSTAKAMLFLHIFGGGRNGCGHGGCPHRPVPEVPKARSVPIDLPGPDWRLHFDAVGARAAQGRRRCSLCGRLFGSLFAVGAQMDSPRAAAAVAGRSRRASVSGPACLAEATPA